MRLESYEPRLAGPKMKPVRDAIRRTLWAGMQAGDTIPPLAERVMAVFPQADETIATDIALTESARIAGLRDLIQWRDSGVCSGKRWSATEHACPLCRELAARGPIPLEALYLKEGERLVAGGMEIVADEPIVAPPLHACCTCMVEAVLRGEG